MLTRERSIPGMNIGIIGGSGLYEATEFEIHGEEVIDTPFGAPSDVYVKARWAGAEIYFLPRHGRGHRFLPSEINHRANLYGFKALGVDRIVAITAVGSLREDCRPGDLLLPTQYFDRTKRHAEQTFFGNGVVAHVSMADPVCHALREHLFHSAQHVVADHGEYERVRLHDGGTYVNMEGPAFSTRAESESYRASGFDVIGMTSLPEAKLAREAQICYAAMAMITDYDCWRESEKPVTAAAVIETVRANTRLAQDVLRRAIGTMPPLPDCACRHALEGAIMTDPAAISEKIRKRFGLLLPQTRGIPD